ncbi:MAG: YggT family protein [Clostridia bacterium]|nr:YggT family protein [Clostridia bacterium]
MNTQVLYFIFYFVRTILIILEIAMMARAILSWIVMLSEGAMSRIYGFLALITEPVVLPFRKLFDHFGWGEDWPIDLPFTLAFFFVMFLSSFTMVL